MIQSLQGILTEVRSSLISFMPKVSPEAVAWAGIVLLLGRGAKKLVNMGFTRVLEERGSDEHAIKSAKKASSYTVYSLTFIVVLGIFGVPPSALSTVLGLVGLGVSFALKDMIANFISGIFLLVNRPFKIGDQIEVDGESGTIQDVKIRATEIKTYDGRKVIIPNSMLFSGKVTNMTAYEKRRFAVLVGVGYDDDIGRARDLAMEAMEESDEVADDPSPQVIVDELAGSSVNLKLRAWTRSQKADMVRASSEITEKVKEKYDAEGIDIPYPIRTVLMEE